MGDVGYVARVFSCLSVYLSPFLCLLVIHAVTRLLGEVREKEKHGTIRSEGSLAGTERIHILLEKYVML